MNNGNGQARGHILLLANQEEKSGMSQKPLSKYMKMISGDHQGKWRQKRTKWKNYIKLIRN